MCFVPTSSLGTYVSWTYLITGYLSVLHLSHQWVGMCFVPTSSQSTYVFCTYLITEYLCVLYLPHHSVPMCLIPTSSLGTYLCAFYLPHHWVPMCLTSTSSLRTYLCAFSCLINGYLYLVPTSSLGTITCSRSSFPSSVSTNSKTVSSNLLQKCFSFCFCSSLNPRRRELSSKLNIQSIW